MKWFWKYLLWWYDSRPQQVIKDLVEETKKKSDYTMVDIPPDRYSEWASMCKWCGEHYGEEDWSSRGNGFIEFRTEHLAEYFRWYWGIDE